MTASGPVPARASSGRAAQAVATPSTHWTVEGRPDAPPIVFLHGAVVGGIWSPQVRALRDRFRCITVDLPGHGRLAAVPYHLDAAIEAVRVAIDEAAGGRAIVVGLSLGGYTAAAFAARHPERVRGLVVADASREPRGRAIIAFLAYGFMLQVLPQRLVRTVGVGLFRRGYGRAIAAELAVGYDARAGGRAVWAIVGRRFRARLAAYGGPVLVLNGARDRTFIRGEREFVAGLRGVRVEHVEGAGHLSNLDRPEAFTHAVVTFAEALQP